MIAINKVLLLGSVTDDGPRLTYTENGTPQCSFTLLIAEPGKDGATFKLFVPVDALGIGPSRWLRRFSRGMWCSSMASCGGGAGSI
jgi:hypothetical protein